MKKQKFYTLDGRNLLSEREANNLVKAHGFSHRDFTKVFRSKDEYQTIGKGDRIDGSANTAHKLLGNFPAKLLNKKDVRRDLIRLGVIW